MSSWHLQYDKQAAGNIFLKLLRYSTMLSQFDGVSGDT